MKLRIKFKATNFKETVQKYETSIDFSLKLWKSRINNSDEIQGTSRPTELVEEIAKWKGPWNWRLKVLVNYMATLVVSRVRIVPLRNDFIYRQRSTLKMCDENASKTR